MSSWGDILVNIREIIQNSDYFEDADVYFDESQMNPNVKLPAICFRTGRKEVVNNSINCREYNRGLEIRLCTKELDKPQLLSDLFDFEEQLIKTINNAAIAGDCLSSYEISETGANRISALMWNARNEGGQYDYTFFCNMLVIKFNIRYTI